MILRIIQVLHQMLPQTAGRVQYTIVPTDDHGAVLVLAFDQDGKTHETPVGFSQQELALATDDQMAEAIERHLAACFRALFQSRGEFLTPEQVRSRLVAARQQAPKLLALDVIARAARGEPNQ